MLLDKVFYYNKILVKWRRYDDSSSSPIRFTNKTNKKEKLYLTKIAAFNERKRLYEKISFAVESNRIQLSQRARLLLENEKKRVNAICKIYEKRDYIGLIFHYLLFRKSYLSVKSLFADLLVLLKAGKKT